MSTAPVPEVVLEKHTIRTPEGDITIGTRLRNMKTKREGQVIAVDVNNRMVRFDSDDSHETANRTAWAQIGGTDDPRFEILGT